MSAEGRAVVGVLALALALWPRALHAEPVLGCEGSAERAELPVEKKQRARALGELRKEAELTCLRTLIARSLELRVASIPSPEARARIAGLAEDHARRTLATQLPDVTETQRQLTGARARIAVRARSPARVLAALIESAVQDEARAPWPRVGVMAYELARERGRERIFAQSVVTGPVGRWLHDRGYDVVPLVHAPLDVADALHDPAALARLAAGASVDALVVGELVVEDGAPASALDKTLDVAFSGRLRVVAMRTERVVAEVPVSGTAIGATVESGVERALRLGLLEQLGRALLGPLRTRVPVAAAELPRRLRIRGLSRRDVGAFVTALKGLAAARAVEVIDVLDGELILEVRYPGEPDVLAVDFVREIDRSKTLGHLELVDVRGAELVFDRQLDSNDRPSR